jgi:hypothetical protein
MKKLLLLLIVLGGLALAPKPAHAQNCSSCNKQAQCVIGGFGGCGCIQRVVGNYIHCAVCGYCFGGCLYNCSGGIAVGPTQPSWVTNATLVERVTLQSPRMGALVSTVQERVKAGACKYLRGHGHSATEDFDWSLLTVKNGSLLMIDNEDGSHEKLSLTGKSWQLTKDNMVLAKERLF